MSQKCDRCRKSHKENQSDCCYGPFGRRLDPDKMWAKNNKMYYEGTTKGSQLTRWMKFSCVMEKQVK